VIVGCLHLYLILPFWLIPVRLVVVAAPANKQIASRYTSLDADWKLSGTCASGRPKK
jgi:hypothetical protein